MLHYRGKLRRGGQVAELRWNAGELRGDVAALVDVTLAVDAGARVAIAGVVEGRATLSPEHPDLVRATLLSVLEDRDVEVLADDERHPEQPPAGAVA